MERHSVDRDTAAYNAVMTAYADGNQAQMVTTLFDKMGENEVRRTAASYKIVTGALDTDTIEVTKIIDCFYEEMVSDLVLYKQYWDELVRDGVLNLDNHSRLLAQAVVRRLLRVLLEQDSDMAQSSRSLIIGKGNHSVGSPVLLEAVQTELSHLWPPIKSYRLGNKGRLGLSSYQLEGCLASQATGGDNQNHVPSSATPLPSIRTHIHFKTHIRF
ncbi:hypothetical protein SARC_00438 [Sphaeroforma arctica JP610]|uniref:Smr domain-containing protein n=1 Tax=Sphaeroforma arctica JP610 TaxID=667725 RepID=A0A0L0GF11_9EUKA|nr:hypothetical protein SARC_00438 [Sphaeroforma arctica JP610]KNC87456.1 hypothetical protein SARC_00438 [Sphaeroforma arctica JP610]|eukprot:XP_014161358.1 hypothetical protein SARC_00438 [Sphaeroforma arctica JP610]